MQCQAGTRREAIRGALVTSHCPLPPPLHMASRQSWWPGARGQSCEPVLYTPDPTPEWARLQKPLVAVRGAEQAPYRWGPISPRAKWGQRLQEGAWIPHTGRTDPCRSVRTEEPLPLEADQQEGARPSPLHPVLTPKGVALASGKGQAWVTEGSCPARWGLWGGQSRGAGGRGGAGGWPWRLARGHLPLCASLCAGPHPCPGHHTP